MVTTFWNMAGLQGCPTNLPAVTVVPLLPPQPTSMRPVLGTFRSVLNVKSCLLGVTWWVHHKEHSTEGQEQHTQDGIRLAGKHRRFGEWW